MKFVSATRALRFLAVAFVLVSVASLATPAAQAGCGDYVTVGRPLVLPNGAEVGVYPRLAHLLASSKHQPITRPTSDLPCHGPSCSKRTPVPSTPTAVVPVGSSQWACLLAGWQPAVPELTESAPSPITPRSERRSTRIEHPPRSF